MYIIKMITRSYWNEKILNAWDKRSLIWLSGIRRVGKTTLAKMLPDTLYLNCDLPSVEVRLADPEFFFNSVEKNKRIIFDEIHKLQDPSRLLKIATDEYPDIKVIATGSSTLEATKKFSDSLAGRKIMINLCPFLWSEIKNHKMEVGLEKRLLKGGLPQALLASHKDDDFFAEWLDSYFARDIQELFEIRNKSGFISMLKLLLNISGGILDIDYVSKQCKITRLTAMSYLQAMIVSHTIMIIPPFFGGGTREIVKRPKVYGFDTGFVTYCRGWDSLRQEDLGGLWEHMVLDEIRSSVDKDRIHYWRDKSGREIDFVVQINSEKVDVIECKFNPDKINISAIKEFRRLYPSGDNYCISPFVDGVYERKIEDHIIKINSNYSKEINKIV